MGINIHMVEFLLEAKALGVAFGDMLTVGRQSLYLRKRGKWPWSKFRHIRKDVQSLMERSEQPDGYAEKLLRNLGATSVSTIDNSEYEHADYISDFNKPISESLIGKFDTLLDGGSLEHIFNVPMALENMMRMIKLDGHLLIATAGDSYCGHGFYQFGPEFFYRTLIPKNGFQLLKVAMCDVSILPKIVEVPDPMLSGIRIEYQLANQSLIFAIARRINLNTPFQSWPQQSLYQSAWDDKLSPIKPQISRVLD